jgi:uncharacterized membrane protein
MRNAPPAARPSVERIALWMLGVFTALAVIGYWNFALHPERLPDTPIAGRFYVISFQFFAQVHILIAASVLATVLLRRTGMRWVQAFAVVYVLSFSAEHLGTGYGIPFGGYGYTGLLGVKVGGRVPALIPVSWFLMAVPSWVFSRWALPHPEPRAKRWLLGASWMVAWDLALDPAMSFLTPYWLWEHTGSYYGMPLFNLLGWGLTSCVLMAALDLTGPGARLDRLPLGWAARYYAIVLLLPLGMVAAAGLWPAVLVTLAGIGTVAGWTLMARRQSRPIPARSVPESASAPTPVGAR